MICCLSTKKIHMIIERVIAIYSFFSDLSRGISKFTGWPIIELSIRRRVRTFVISWGQTTRVKHCCVNLSLWYEFWLAIIFIDMNVIWIFEPPYDNLRRAKYWPFFAVKLNLHRRFMSAHLDVLCPNCGLYPMVVHRKTYILMFLR